MKTINPEHFALLCYAVLMQDVGSKAPDYMIEKSYILDAGYDAFGALDIYNMRKVKQWCDEWNVELPSAIAEYLELTETAYTELQGRGFDL